MNEISPLNNKEIQEVLSELRLKGSFLRKVIQPDFKSLALTFFREDESVVRVFFDLSAYSSALYPVPENNHTLKNKDLRFMQLLRAQCQGGYIKDVYQYGNERIIVFHVKHLEKDKFLYFRLWGARTNVFLCDHANRIMDVFYRRPKSQEFSGHIYSLPEKRPILGDHSLRDIAGKGSFGQRLYDLYFFSREQNERRNALLDEFLLWHQTRYEEIQAKRDGFARKLIHNQAAVEDSKKNADLLMSHQSLESLKTSESQSIVLTDFDGVEHVVEIDPFKSFVENAQIYYEKKKKLSKENENIQERLEILSAEEDALNALWNLQADEGFLLEKRWLKKQSIKPLALQGLLFQHKEYLICVGRSARENDHLLRKFVRGRDWWFHVRDFSGGYVFVITKKKEAFLPQELTLVACELAAHYSKAKDEKVLDIYCTQVKNLKRVKKQLGKVVVAQEKNITYRRDEERLRLIMRDKL